MKKINAVLFIVMYLIFFSVYARNIDSRTLRLDYLNISNEADSLSVNCANISNISKISKFVNLKYIDLRGNNITDLTPLSKLKLLEELYLDDNLIEDISPLLKLKNLRILSLNHNKIKKIDTKMKNRKLEKFSAAFNDIESISGITGLPKLIDINLQNNNIKDISTLGSNPEILYVWLDNNRINSIKPLLTCNKLREVWINNNPVEDMKSLSSLDSLEWIWFDNKSIVLWEKEKPIRFDDLVFENFVRDLVDIHDRDLYPSDLQNINEVNFVEHEGYIEYRQNRISESKGTISIILEAGFSDKLFFIEEDIPEKYVALPINRCKSLKCIKYFNNLREVRYPARLNCRGGNLEVTSIQKNYAIKELREIIALQKIEIFDIRNTGISYIPDLSDLKELKTLIFENCHIFNIDNMSGITNLERLSLQNNLIRKLPDFCDYNDITSIDISDNNLPSIDLSSFDRLKYLNCSKNKIAYVNSDIYLHKLTNLNISFNDLESLDFIIKCRMISDLDISATNISDLIPLEYTPLIRNLKLEHLNCNIMSILDRKFASKQDFKISLFNSKIPKNERDDFLKKLKKLQEKE